MKNICHPTNRYNEHLDVVIGYIFKSLDGAYINMQQILVYATQIL